jgi:glycosyltransferase involved in cell wall biosynthesis
VAGDAPPEPIASAMHRVVLVDGAPRPSRRARARQLTGLLGRRYVPEVQAAQRARQGMLDVLQSDRSLREATVSVVNHLPLAPLLPALPGAAVFHPYHVASEVLAGQAAQAAGTHAMRLRQYAANARRVERWATRTAAMTFVVSDEDAALFGLDGAAATVAPNAVDAASTAGLGPRSRDPVVLFPASLDYPPNADGALWLGREIWPLVRQAAPEARLQLVGRAPGPSVRALAELPGVEVHADVPDMTAWLRTARVVVVPLRFGSGTRLKALEAMAAGRPLVGTSVGLAGLGIEDGVHAHVADDAPALAAALLSALSADGDALVEPARRLVEERFTWPVVAATLAGAIDRLDASRR